MKQETPMQELIDELMVGELSKKISNYNRMLIIGWINKNKLLEKEKQAIIDAYSNAQKDVFKIVHVDAETYFNNKYNTK